MRRPVSTDRKKLLLWLSWSVVFGLVTVGKIWLTDLPTRFVLTFVAVWCLVPLFSRYRGGTGLASHSSILGRDSG